MISLPLAVTLVHGLGLVGLAAAIGGLVLDGFILPAGAPEVVAARGRLRRWITAALIGLALTTAADLLLRTQVMARAPLVVAVGAVPDVLARTHFGSIWIARSVGLVLALALSLARPPALRVGCLLVALGVALTTTLGGHAAEWGDLTVSVAVDWTHAVTASAWTGGLVALPLVVLRQDPAWSPMVLGGLARRFSRLAGACLLAVALTGAYNAWTQLGPVSTLWTSPYGRALLLKLLVVAALASLGAATRYLVVPQLGSGRPSRGAIARLSRLARLALLGRPSEARLAAPARFSDYLAAEAVLAIAVFACTAVLCEGTPGRHAQALERSAAGHVTVKEFLQRRAAGRGASLTPPPGDAIRGRAVFARLRCFACHLTRGEPFPPPERPGPELIGAGRLPPAYLVESIMNPDAMIVDGPGYAGPDGSSIMPDHREKLTVGELIDLVAYLKGLQGMAPPSAGAEIRPPGAPAGPR
jgi:copper resistance protein D